MVSQNESGSGADVAINSARAGAEGTQSRVPSVLWPISAVAFGAAVVGLLATQPQLRLAAFSAAAGLLVLGLAVAGLVRWRGRMDRLRLSQLALLTEQDATPCFATDSTGRITLRNAAARQRFGMADADTLIAALGGWFASPAAVLFRLHSRAQRTGAAREDVVTSAGHLRLSVYRIGAAQFVWRIEEFEDRQAPGQGGDGVHLPMLVANKSGVVLYANEAMRRLSGGRPRTLQSVFSGPLPPSGELVDVAGASGPVRAVLAELAGPGERREIYLLPVSLDPAAEEAPQATEFEHVPVPLLKLAPEGLVRAMNRQARDLLELDDARGLTFADLFEGLGRPVTDWLSDVAAGRNPGGAEVLRCRRRETEDSFFQVTLRRIVERGRSGAVAVLSDATALKTLEAQFIQSQKMQAIGQLAGGIAHDFNNLLTAISGHCDLLLLRHDASDQDYSDLVQIHQNANRAAALVRQLLAFSRKQTLAPEFIDLQETLSDLMHLLNRLVGERITLKLAHAPGLGTIRADRRQFEQVLMNLVVNARDAMPEGGTIRVETEALVLAGETRRGRARIPAGSYAVIRVSDTGCGIPPDRIDKIFEPFFTTKRPGEGTGLGLSMAYGIVKQSGGYIFADSTPGEGSVFEVIFPVHEAADDRPVAPHPEPVRRPIATPTGGVVLLVEDEAPVRAFASRALRLRGFTVLEAENAEDALRTLEDPSVAVDIFVTDVVMPGMDGPSWVRQALRDRPDVRVIFVSGYAEEDFADAQTRIPNSVFLPKPFSLTDLAETVQRQLH
ncbi:response regulator [Aliigemmobacter aestuarii]|uniref:histidine kinase n=1 Tax=Aliigemmobacter aestuarii TaxID=1445661 RepID=A0A4S3MPC9_9RHOB|nr:ATP-binding protein [Gemmobacter aestuarii]THD83009.1 response regulator [Gemmobacter aestuarii]